MSTFDRVKEFHKVFNIPYVDKTPDEILFGRIKLIVEEFIEVLEAAHFDIKTREPGKPIELLQFKPFSEVDKKHLLKELADLDYVIAGTAEVFNWDFNEAGERVHKSNMSKLNEDGEPVYRNDGKVLKGPNYREPYLGDLV